MYYFFMGKKQKPKSLKLYLIPITISLVFIIGSIVLYFLNRLIPIDAYVLESISEGDFYTTTFQYEFLGKTYTFTETLWLRGFSQGSTITAFTSIINPSKATLESILYSLSNFVLLIVSLIPFGIGIFILMITIPCYFIDKNTNKKLQQVSADNNQ